MEDLSKHIKVGELSIPMDYWSMSEEQKLDLSLTLMDGMITILDQVLTPEYDRFTILDKLLESSIQTNEYNEEYEICEVMTSIRKILND
jgi:hypothetical protein